MVRGLRGATTVENNKKDEIVKETQRLLLDMVNKNNIKIEDIICIIFSTTSDINDAYPAEAARLLGWNYVPLLCLQEAFVKNGLQNCIRVLMLVNSDKTQREMIHVYLNKATELRKDLNEN